MAQMGACPHSGEIYTQSVYFFLSIYLYFYVLAHLHRSQGTLKMQDMKQRERKQRHQNVPKCRGGNCEKRKLWHKLHGVENTRHEHSGKAECGKPLVVKYR